jgi:hypothetical protein
MARGKDRCSYFVLIESSGGEVDRREPNRRFPRPITDARAECRWAKGRERKQYPALNGYSHGVEAWVLWSPKDPWC